MSRRNRKRSASTSKERRRWKQWDAMYRREFGNIERVKKCSDNETKENCLRETRSRHSVCEWDTSYKWGGLRRFEQCKFSMHKVKLLLIQIESPTPRIPIVPYPILYAELGGLERNAPFIEKMHSMPVTTQALLFYFFAAMDVETTDRGMKIVKKDDWIKDIKQITNDKLIAWSQKVKDIRAKIKGIIRTEAMKQKRYSNTRSTTGASFHWPSSKRAIRLLTLALVPRLIEGQQVSTNLESLDNSNALAPTAGRTSTTSSTIVSLPTQAMVERIKKDKPIVNAAGVLYTMTEHFGNLSNYFDAANVNTIPAFEGALIEAETIQRYVEDCLPWVNRIFETFSLDFEKCVEKTFGYTENNRLMVRFYQDLAKLANDYQKKGLLKPPTNKGDTGEAGRAFLIESSRLFWKFYLDDSKSREAAKIRIEEVIQTDHLLVYFTERNKDRFGSRDKFHKNPMQLIKDIDPKYVNYISPDKYNHLERGLQNDIISCLRIKNWEEILRINNHNVKAQMEIFEMLINQCFSLIDKGLDTIQFVFLCIAIIAVALSLCICSCRLPRGNSKNVLATNVKGEVSNGKAAEKLNEESNEDHTSDDEESTEDHTGDDEELNEDHTNNGKESNKDRTSDDKESKTRKRLKFSRLITEKEGKLNNKTGGFCTVS